MPLLLNFSPLDGTHSDRKIISAFFSGLGIREGFGKVSMLGAWAHVRFWEGVRVRFPHYSRLTPSSCCKPCEFKELSPEVKVLVLIK